MRSDALPFATCALASVICGLALSAMAGETDDPAALRRQLTGTWTGAVVSGGSARPGPPRNSLRAVVSSPERITAHGSDWRVFGLGTYTVPRGADGRLTIDATGTDGPARWQTMLGIWKLDAGALHWCCANSSKTLPAEFRTRSSGALPDEPPAKAGLIFPNPFTP